MKESAKSSEVTRPDMSSLQINLITPCAVRACHCQRRMHYAEINEFILPTFLICTSVRAGPFGLKDSLVSYIPRFIRNIVPTLYQDLCTDEPETRFIIHDHVHDVIHARKYAQTVSQSIRMRTTPSDCSVSSLVGAGWGARARRGGGGSGSHSVGTFFSRRPSRPRSSTTLTEVPATAPTRPWL